MTYTEDALVEQPAIKLFEILGWDALNCWEEYFGNPHPNPRETSHRPVGEGVFLGRENRGDVVLVNRLRSALDKLNPDSPGLAIDEAVETLARNRSVMSAIAANEQIVELCA